MSSSLALLSFAVAFGIYGSAFLLIHVGSLSWRRSQNILRATLLQALLTLPLSLGVLSWGRGHFDEAAAILLALGSWLSFFFAASVYAVLFPTMAERSLSVFLLVLLDRSGGELNRQKIMEVFSVSKTFESRFREHEQAGLVRAERDSLKLTARGRLLARIYVRLIRVLKLHAGIEEFGLKIR